MVHWGFHYVTDKPKNLIASFKRRDLRTIEFVRLMKEMTDRLKDAFPLETADLTSPELTEEELEDTVVIQRGSIVSAYPIIETVRQIDNETWVKFDTRPSSLAQKNASLYCERVKGNLTMEFWSKGEKRAVISPHDRLSKDFAVLLCNHFDKEEVKPKHVMEALKITDDAQKIRQLETLLPFPFFLYSDWRSHWQAKAISPHLYLVSEEELE